jgi:hypothetical protein
MPHVGVREAVALDGVEAVLRLGGPGRERGGLTRRHILRRGLRGRYVRRLDCSSRHDRGSREARRGLARKRAGARRDDAAGPADR